MLSSCDFFDDIFFFEKLEKDQQSDGVAVEIEALLGTKVYLELFVKVKEKWRESTIAISNFGYK